MSHLTTSPLPVSVLHHVLFKESICLWLVGRGSYWVDDPHRCNTVNGGASRILHCQLLRSDDGRLAISKVLVAIRQPSALDKDVSTLSHHMGNVGMLVAVELKDFPHALRLIDLPLEAGFNVWNVRLQVADFPCFFLDSTHVGPHFVFFTLYSLIVLCQL